MGIFGKKCHICGSGPVKVQEQTSSWAGGESPVIYSSEDVWKHLEKCPECQQWTCYNCWDSDYHSRCKSCVPSWQRKIQEAEQAEAKRKVREEEERRRLVISENEKRQELRYAEQQREKEKRRQERKCHVCGELEGDYSSSTKCSKCNQWTCSKHIYRGLCKNCAERL